MINALKYESDNNSAYDSLIREGIAESLGDIGDNRAL